MLREAGLTSYVALLRAGTDFDTQPELPGIGHFNHAIVVVEGNPRIWVDPTDEFARAGELPLQDQGRMALIAMPSTTSLTKVPESESTVNRTVEMRTFELPEDGKARVVETTETNGVNDAWQRRMYASSDRARYREAAEEYAKGYYFAKSVEKIEAGDPHDLAKPFRITLEVTESGSGIVSNGEGEVAFHPAGLLSGLPPQLRANLKEEDKKTRTHDFLIPTPAVKEWVYRIDPPAGYVARTLPASETKQLGTTTLTTEYTTQSDGVVLAKVRFDSGKRRLSPAEFAETRDAVAKLLETDRVIIGFESVGQTKLNAGDVAGALAEFRRLTELHPTHAQHHLELARTLLAGGLGDAARETVRQAIGIEPANWRVYEMQSRVLQHDLLARPFRRGFDLQGAIAAMRKAKELDAKNAGVRAALARLLTYGEDGAQFGRNAKLTEAIDEYRSLLKELPDEGKRAQAELMLVLAHAGRFMELRELTKTMDVPAQRDMGRILAVAVDAGADAALKELSAFDASTRRNYSIAIGQTLVQLRRYPQAAALLDSAAQGAPNAAELRPFIETLKKAKRIEDVAMADDDPSGIVRKVFAAMMSGNRDAAIKLLAPDVAQLVATIEKEEEDPFAPPHQTPDDMPPAVTADFVTSMLQVQTDGDEERGWRLRTRMSGGERGNEMTYFVTKEDGHYVLRGVSHAPDLVGWSVLRFANAGQLERARTWLNWMREEISAGGGDDPLRGAAFPILWPKGKMTATADEIRTAAASLMMRSGNKTSEPILLAMREKTSSDDVKVRIDSVLAAIYMGRRDWKTLETVAGRIYDKYPESSVAFMTYTTALTNTGNTAKTAELSKKRLDATANDPDALRALSQNAAKSGDWKAAHDHALKLVDQLSQNRSDYNNAAWYALFTRKDFDKALEQARYASENRDASSLHTLAALYAETGNSIEARDALLRSMDNRGNEDPTGIDWYVLGRIAENYHLRDAALAAYEKAKADREDDDDSVLELTDRRLAALGKK
jgi:tetratricopeptide (TPR) repeat protein